MRQAQDQLKDPPRTLPHRAVLEQRFGADLSWLSVQDGPSARGVLQAMGVRAAVVDDTILADGPLGLEAVAHEVAHALQGRDAPGASGVSQPGDPAEQDADRAARAVASGKPATVEAAPTGALQCGWGDFFSGVAETITDAGTAAWSGVTDTVSEVVEATTEVASEVYEGATETATAAWGGVTDTVSQIAETASETATTVLSDPTDFDAIFDTVTSGASDTAGAAWAGVTDTVAELGEAKDEVSAEVVEGIVETSMAAASGLSQTGAVLEGGGSQAVADLGEIKDDLVDDVMDVVGIGLDHGVEGVSTFGDAADVATGQEVEDGNVAVPELGDDHFYAHGGGMATVEQLIADQTWRLILARLEPELFHDLLYMESTLADSALDHWGTGFMYAVGDGEIDVSDEWMSRAENSPVVAAYYQWLSGGTVPLEMDVWPSLDDPSDLSETRVAHGNALTTVGEKTDLGVAQDLGGDVATSMSVDDWLLIFGQASAMAESDSTQVPDLTSEQMMADAIASLNTSGGVILDIKETDATPEQIAAFVAAVEDDGQLDVLGVGSFDVDQLSAIDDREDRLLFFNSFNDVLHADEADLQQVDKALFNLSQLLEKDADGNIVPNDAKVAELAAFVDAHPDIQLGGYVQETNFSAESMEAVAQILEDSDLLELGVAYGNQDGQADASTQGRGSNVSGVVAAQS